MTALARIEGRPVGILASNPAHLGGAIDADAADKAARFMQLCDAHGLPIVSLVDTPGFMVGPEIETRGQVRHVSRMFVVAAQLRVPVVAVVLRKAYGLGAMAMAAGGMHAPLATASWPSGEFGAMGLEGAVELGFRKELDAAPEGAERDALRERLVEAQYAKGKALNMAATLEIDAVIDPAETRALAGGDARQRQAGAAEWPIHRPVVRERVWTRPLDAAAPRSTTRFGEDRSVGPVVRLQRRMRRLVADEPAFGFAARGVGRASRLGAGEIPALHVFDPVRIVHRRSYRGIAAACLCSHCQAAAISSLSAIPSLRSRSQPTGGTPRPPIYARPVTA